LNIEGLPVGLLLAGGAARRMGGGDKCLRPLAGRPLLAHVIERLRDQVGELVLNANGDPARFADFGLPVVADVISGSAGPLAGILTGMEWLRAHRPGARWLATFPTDAPFLPADLVARLADALNHRDARLACAGSAGRSHPPIGLWDVSLADDLRAAMEGEGLRKIDRWTARHGVIRVDWPDRPHAPFFNANRPEDLAEAERLLAAPAG
jgi:molybdopterin-guanine dinucleotide biosynthesis protein A